MQSFRKYVEHVGLTGSTVNSSTRSIVAEGWVAAFVNFTLLHEPYHGVHHWRSGLPHPELPGHAAALEPNMEQERPALFAPSVPRCMICSSILPIREWVPSGTELRARPARNWPSEGWPDGDS